MFRQSLRLRLLYPWYLFGPSQSHIMDVAELEQLFIFCSPNEAISYNLARLKTMSETVLLNFTTFIYFLRVLELSESFFVSCSLGDFQSVELDSLWQGPAFTDSCDITNLHVPESEITKKLGQALMIRRNIHVKNDLRGPVRSMFGFVGVRGYTTNEGNVRLIFRLVAKNLKAKKLKTQANSGKD